MQIFAFLKPQYHGGPSSVPEVAHLQMEKLVTFFLLFFLTAGAVLPLFFKCIEVFVFVPSVAEKKLGVCFPEGLVPSAGCRGGWCIFEDSLGTSVERQDQKIFICLVDKYKLLWLLASKFYYLDF